MTERIERLKNLITSGGHFSLRNMDYPFDTSSYRTEDPYVVRVNRRTRVLLDAQTPCFLEGHGFVPMLTTPLAPDMLSDEERTEIGKTHCVPDPDRGRCQNLSPDYQKLIDHGLLHFIEEIGKAEKTLTDPDALLELAMQKESCEMLLSFAERYRAAAEKAGKTEIAERLARVPAYGARTLAEAMQTFRLVHFMLWCEGNYHITCGRMDQYFYPYLERDLAEGRLTRESALELIEDFYLSFNIDSDLYPGRIHGNNGQSIVLGGYDEDGTDRFNLLSELMMQASLELRVIDPKINLRVNHTTPVERYEFGSRLTAAGIGFPQNCNDDAVIPGLVRLGYDKKDAYNYVVAACWEFIVPGVGMDIPNIDALSFLGCVNHAVREDLPGAETYEDFLAACDRRITADAQWRTTRHRNLFLVPSPFMSVCMDGLTEKGKDISQGAKYNNLGIHGTGIANAVDSIAAVKKLVYEEGMPRQELVDILRRNWEGAEELRTRIVRDFPKFGDDDPLTNGIASHILATFSHAIYGRKNERGGIYRGGTGTALFYIVHGVYSDASPDGRKKGDYLPANYSPSLNAQGLGPFSIIRSFTAPDLSLVINGGPLTLEFSPSVVRSKEADKKIGRLVKTFIDMGGHQIQLNVIEKAALIDAQKHPEKYRNLIVRVWGWSGYFTELDKVYQDQIIMRADLSV